MSETKPLTKEEEAHCRHCLALAVGWDNGSVARIFATLDAERLASERRHKAVIEADELMTELEAENERLRAMLAECRIHVYASNEAEHLTDGFSGRKPKPTDEMLARIDAALATEKPTSWPTPRSKQC